VRKGPPPLPMRLIAPIVVVSTIVVFVTGVLLLIDGPSDRDQFLQLHKVSFIVWVVFAGLVLAIAFTGQFGAWTAPGAIPHHHHHAG
jgi:hypothetical protein